MFLPNLWISQLVSLMVFSVGGNFVGFLFGWFVFFLFLFLSGYPVFQPTDYHTSHRLIIFFYLELVNS